MSAGPLTSAEDERLLQAVAQLQSQGLAAVSPLVELLAAPSWVVRRAAVDALAHLPNDAAPLLSAALAEQRSSEPVISGLVDALSSSRAAVEPEIRRLLEHPEPGVLCDAAQILGRRGDRDSELPLVRLTDHADDNVALSAIEALGRLGGQAAVERLIELAAGANFFRVFPALDALGRCRDSRALGVLSRLIEQPLYAAEAARALGRLGSVRAIPALLKSMRTGPDAILRNGAQALVALQATAATVGPASAVRKAVREHADAALRDRVARAMAFADGAEQLALGRVLIWLASEDNVPSLLALLQQSDEMATLGVDGLKELRALGEPLVLNALQAGSSELRGRLLPAFMGVKGATQALAACLTDEVPSVRALACHALSRGSDISVVPQLFALLKDADLGVVHAAVGAIQSLGSADTERLALAAARSSDAAERRLGLRIVTYLGYPPSFELCVEALRTQDSRLRDIALAALPALDDAGVVPLLISTASDAATDARTRASAIRALGSAARSAEAETVLQQSLADADAWVRYYACQALGRLAVVEALPAIVALLDDPAGQVQMAAVEALTRMPGPLASESLARAAQSEDAELRRVAVVSIGERAEEALRPIVEAALASSDSAIRLVAVSSIARFAGAESRLGEIARTDSDSSVSRAAVELLAQNAGAPASVALLALLSDHAAHTAAQAALNQHLAARIPALLAGLDNADDLLARRLLSVLSSSELPVARNALDAAFSSSNPAARRAAARVLSLLLDDDAKTTLARAASRDSDAEVRRISAAAIA